VYSGQYRDEEAFDRVREQYGLDKPVHEQYWIWLKGVALDADFGPSFQYRDRDIPELLWPKIWVSMRVSFWAFLLTYLIGVPVGVFAATRQGKWTDPMSISVLLFFTSIPVFVMVPILVLVLAANLHLVPPGGFDGIFSKSIIIPTIALTLPALAGIARLSRTTTLTTLHEDYVRTARAKGLREGVVMRRHVARTSLVPVLTTVVGLSLVGLIEGAFFTETLLGIPGIGSFMVESVAAQDYNVVMTFVLLTTVVFVTMNLLVDVLLVIIDPRIRASRVGEA
jgi:ABC-type dipeptide/oligopeptide/nickel transport system permease component